MLNVYKCAQPLERTSHSAHTPDPFVPLPLFILNYLSLSSHHLPPREFCFLQVSLSTLHNCLCFSSHSVSYLGLPQAFSDHTVLEKTLPPTPQNCRLPWGLPLVAFKPRKMHVSPLLCIYVESDMISFH